MIRALILCAGLGTRLGYKTKPKCMAKVGSKPILEHIVDNLNKHGITDIMVNLYINPKMVMEYFGHRLNYFIEEEPLGREKTIKLLKSWLGKEYFVINGDTLADVDFSWMMRQGPCRIVNFDNGHFGGTELVDGKKRQFEFDIPYFDCGTPAKLARARRWYVRNH